MTSVNTRPQRTARKKQKYSVDAFEGLDDALQESHASGISASEADSGTPSDGEFGQSDLDDLVELEHEDAQDEDDLASEPGHEYASNAQNDDSEGEEVLDDVDDELVEVATTKREYRPSGPTRSQRRARLMPTDDKDLPQYSRGLIETFLLLASDNKMLMTVAQEEEELIPFIKVRDRWMDALSLPSRGPIKDKGGGLMQSPFFIFDTVKASRDWRWYQNSNGSSKFHDNQQLHLARRKIRNNAIGLLHKPSNLKFLAGPARQQSLHTLSGGESKGVHEFFSSDPNVKHGRSGWIINFGSPVQCLEWIQPNESILQCLAISPRSGLAGSRSAAVQSGGGPDALSSFVPQPERQSQLYIYSFAAKAGNTAGARMDMSQKPSLRAVISYRWNELRRLKFCPAHLPPDGNGSRPRRLGLMAGVWLDGHVRVLDIDLPDKPGTAVIDVEKAAFEARPPDTVCTAVTWLSTSSIAVSCANGSVAIWNLANCIGQKNPKPWFYKTMHESYILNIVSAYPSKPTFIFTNGIDGWLKMTDIRDPRADTVTTYRHRLMQLPLTWSDHCQCILNAGEMFGVSVHFLRYFHAESDINRLPASILDIATSSLHPYALIACSDGSVYSTNITAKLRSVRKTETNRQMWFKHEYRDAIPTDLFNERQQASAEQREKTAKDATVDDDTMDIDQDQSTENPTETVDEDDSSSKNILKEPLIRMTEGYKIEHAYLDTNKSNTKQKPGQPIIYERQTAIERVAWNPNLIAGTWAAAAAGSGLIRVEDIGIDG